MATHTSPASPTPASSASAPSPRPAAAAPAGRRVLSGIQPTAVLHLGNYLGALRQWARMQDEYECFFCIVDLHALTTRQDPAELRRCCRSLAALYLASGIDPQKSAIFIQSHLPEHCELQWLLSTFTMMGELEKMTQFKDKSKRHNQNINAGLLMYPVLMAADILLYQANRVPVGHDQKQHLELARNIAVRFNNAYETDVFTVPEAMIPLTGARIMDLQHPDRKMSKSEQPAGTLEMLESPDALRKKLRRSVTDSLATIAFDPERQPGVANLLSILASIRGGTTAEQAVALAGKGYGALKDAVADAVIEVLTPIQARYAELSNDAALLDRVLHEGADRARAVAGPTLRRAKETVGLLMPR